MQSRDGGDGGRGRGHSSSSRGRGNPLNGRGGRSAPFQNGQGRHTQSHNGMAFPCPYESSAENAFLCLLSQETRRRLFLKSH